MQNANEEVKIPRRILGSLLNATAAGVVPRSGLEYIAIGRQNEIGAILNDFENISCGMGAFRLLIGKYGSGKSFLIGLMRSNALERGFITADADLSPERRFVGNRGQGLAVFRELMNNLASKTSPDRGALQPILAKWLSSLQLEIIKKTGLDSSSPLIATYMEKEVLELVGQIQTMVNGFDFAKALMAYYKGYISENDELKQCALRWLKGEFNTKTEARMSLLGISSIIDDTNWYEYIKIYAVFFRKIGYKGFVVFIDECVNLYKIPNRISRENNYEKILSMFNDTLQDKAEGLGIIIGGTPQFLSDERRGLYSYEALKSRLKESRFSVEGMRDLMGPVIYIERLSDNELYALILRIKNLHAMYYSWQPRLSEEDTVDFLKLCVEKIGADSMITPREVIRDFLSLLNILYQNPEMTFEKILESGNITLKSEQSDDDDDFFDIDTIDI